MEQLPVCEIILGENLIEVTEADDEEDGRDVVETLNPFLPLRSLAAHINKLKSEIFALERDDHNPRGHRPRPEDVLVCWKVVLRCQPLCVGEEIRGRVIQLDMRSPEEVVITACVT